MSEHDSENTEIYMENDNTGAGETHTGESRTEENKTSAAKGSEENRTTSTRMSALSAAGRKARPENVPSAQQYYRLQ